jgi:glycine betaine/proline transport system substrate-binding protein
MRDWRRFAVNALTAIIGIAAFVYLLQLSRPAKPPPSPAGPVIQRHEAVPTVGPATEAAPNETPAAIRIGWTAWTDAEVVTNIVRRVLEDRFGIDVELVMADIGIQYQGVASGDLDLMLMSWQPLTHRDYWRRFADDVVNLGVLYTRARLGWAVPAFVPEDQLSSIADLAKPAVRDRLDGKIQGIDPGSGLMQVSEVAKSRYGLDDYELVPASGAAMTAALARAIDRQEWIVVTAWSPHWMFARWKLRYLDDPKRVFGGRERVHVLVREGFYQDYPPEISEFLARVYFPIDELEAALLIATRESVDAAVDDYLQRHPDRIDYWVTGQLSGRRQGNPAPPDVAD